MSGDEMNPGVNPGRMIPFVSRGKIRNEWK
jgi:hypothetical protein